MKIETIVECPACCAENAVLDIESYIVQCWQCKKEFTESTGVAPCECGAEIKAHGDAKLPKVCFKCGVKITGPKKNT